MKAVILSTIIAVTSLSEARAACISDDIRSRLDALRACVEAAEAGKARCDGDTETISRGLARAARQRSCASEHAAAKAELEGYVTRLNAANARLGAAPAPTHGDKSAPAATTTPPAAGASTGDRWPEVKNFRRSFEYLLDVAAKGDAGKGEADLRKMTKVIDDLQTLEKKCASDPTVPRFEAIQRFCAELTGARAGSFKKYIGASAQAIVAGLPAAYAAEKVLKPNWNSLISGERWAYYRDQDYAMAAEEKALKPYFDYAGLPFPAAEIEQAYVPARKAVMEALDKVMATKEAPKGKASSKLKKEAKAYLDKTCTDKQNPTSMALLNATGFEVVAAYEPTDDWKMHKNNLGAIVGRSREFVVVVKVKDEKHCRPFRGHIKEDHAGNGKFINTRHEAASQIFDVVFTPCPR